MTKTDHDGLRGCPVFWATQQDSAEEKKGRVEEDKATKKQRKQQRKQAELRIKARWRKVVNAVGQGAQPMERARIVVQARQRRAELGQLLLQAADRGVEGVRLRGVLARALYNWGLGHERDRAQYRKLVVLAGVRGDILARWVGGLLVYWPFLGQDPVLCWVNRNPPPPADVLNKLRPGQPRPQGGLQPRPARGSGACCQLGAEHQPAADLPVAGLTTAI